MVKIVINRCYGGFGLSEAAENRYAELKGIDPADVVYYEIERHDPVLVQVVEELGEDAGYAYSDLQIVEVPAGTRYRIDEYDGFETLNTMDDYDWKIA